MNQAIYDRIKEQILYLEYQPGQILNENQLARQFGVSRTPMREVLQRLEHEQLVRVLSRSGVMVTEIEFPKMLNTYQVRFEIEALAGRLAAENVTTEHIQQLAAIEAECGQVAHERNRRELVQTDRNFRKVLYDAAGNPVLQDVSDHLYDLTLRLWFASLERGQWEYIVKDLAAEIKATKDVWMARNSRQAATLRRDFLMRHFTRIRDHFLGTGLEWH